MAKIKSDIKVKLETKPQLSEIEELRKENERLRREKELLEHENQETKRFELARKKLSPAKFGAAKIREMVPAFNPPKSCISSKQWLDILENYRNIYRWDDRSTMFYASFRMEKAARSWYLGRGSGIVRWNEFKDQLVKTFPPPKTQVGTIVPAATPTAATPPGSTATTLTPQATTLQSSTLNAATLPVLNLGASTSPAATAPESLTPLVTPRVQESVQPKLSRRQRRRENLIHRMNTDQGIQICFLCRETGHFARECPNPTASALCYQMRIVKSSATIRNDNGLIKTVTVDGIFLKTFIDLGSDSTTLKLQDAKQNHWNIEEFVAQLNGFSGNSVLVLGKFRGVVKVDEVTKPIDIFVVPNNSQKYSLIVGRNFLNSPDVCVIKRFGSLEVKSVQI